MTNPTPSPQAIRDMPVEAIKNLREYQKQLDMDGCHVGVSRQALDEVLDYIDRAPSPTADAITDAEIMALAEKHEIWVERMCADHVAHKKIFAFARSLLSRVAKETEK
jgi:hypothetical protein